MTDGVKVLGRGESQRQRDLLRVGEAVEAALPLAKPGHEFTKQWLAEQLGLTWPHPASGDERDKWRTHYMGLVKLWRDAMGEHHIHTNTTYKESYAVVPPGESVDLSEQQMRQTITKALRQGKKQMEIWVDPQMLSPQQRQRRIEALGRRALLADAIRQARPRPPKLPVPTVQALPALPEPNEETAG